MSTRLLAGRLAVAVLLGVAAIVTGGLIGVHVHALPALTIAVVAGFLWTVISTERTLESTVDWHAPTQPVPHARAAADITTRRLATICADASPRRGFTPSALQRVLRERAAEALERRGLAPDFRANLSPGLADFLEAPVPPNVTRRVLRTYLKELQ